MDKSRNEKYLQIIKRAEHDGIFTGSIISALRDIESVDKIFNLSLDEWLNADFFDFTNDFIGILDNIKRNRYPAMDFGYFVPRFSKKYKESC